ncbi:MAG: hypothetical protein AAFQ51_18600, partial [Pseudomonadota bacterium]
ALLWMPQSEPTASNIFYAYAYAYASGVVGTYAGGVVGLYLTNIPRIQTLAVGLGGITILLVVNALHDRAGVVVLSLALPLPIYPAYFATWDDPHEQGMQLWVTRNVNMRPGPGLHFEPPPGVLRTWTRVVLEDRSATPVHFHRESGRYYNYWRLVSSPHGVGWVYGAYLEPPP